MKVYTAAQMREREQAAVDKGTSFDQLMETPAAQPPKTSCSVILKPDAP